MTILQLLLAMLYIGLTTYCLELIYSNKQEIRNVFQTLAILYWIGISILLLIWGIVKSLKYLHTPIDITFVVFIGIIILAWIFSKKFKNS